MRKYNDQIDDNIIKEVLKDDYNEYKRIAKEYSEISDLKAQKENELRDKIESRVIGKLHGINLRYIEWNDTFYVSYGKNSSQKSCSIFEKIILWWHS